MRLGDDLRGGLAGTPGGYVEDRMRVSELRVPADPECILVVKRAAAAFATIAEFPLEAIDDLVIAVAQACDNAIDCSDRAVGRGRGQLRVVFRLDDHRLDVKVHTACSKADIMASMARRQVVDVTQQLDSGEREDVRRTRRSAERLLEESAGGEREATEMALRLMGLFVDDCRYRVDERTGGLRVRLTKYRAS